MTAPDTITVYSDYKSPYAYLAKDPTYALAADFVPKLVRGGGGS